MHLDFPSIEQRPKERIVLRPADDAFGPYGFDVSGALPAGVTLTDVSATAFLEGSDSTWTEAPDLIEPESETVTGDGSLQLKLQGSNDSGDALASGRYVIQLTLSLSNSGTRTLLFGPVLVEAFSA